MEIEIIVAVVILLALVFLSTVDMAFLHLSDVSLRRISADAELAQKKTSAQFLREIIENRARFRFTLSSVIQILLISFAVLLTLILLTYTSNQGALLFFGLFIGLGLTVILRQIVPRLIVRTDTEKKLLFLLPAARPLYNFATFVVEPFITRSNAREAQRLDTTVTPDNSDDRTDDNTDDLQALIEVGEAEGIIEHDERALIETMVEFGDTRAGEIMTPRTEIIAIPIGSTVREARDVIIAEKYSRLPVFRDSIDNIEGVIYVRDLLQAWSDGNEDLPVSGILRDPFMIPETKSADELLKSMQLNHVQIAIVIDEYGGVAGLVTVEDLLEEIVGEIEDEDIEEEEIIEIIEGDDGYFDVIGSTEVDKIERLFDMDLEDEDYTTIAGLVTSEAGYVPKTGDILSLRGLEVTILQADEKKIHLLRLRLARESDEDESEALA
ncbi:MAG: hemolysin family protein [Acidobacteriota bacterium]